MLPRQGVIRSSSAATRRGTRYSLVGLALVLACANGASMMLARGVARQPEIGIRLSLGAARGPLIRQLLTESLLLSVPAAFLGWIVSRITIAASLRTMYATVPHDMLE